MMDLITALIKENLVTKEQVNDARDKQPGAKKPLHELLVDMGFLKEEDLMRVSSRIYSMPVLKLEDETIDATVIKMIPCEVVKRYGIFPLRKEKDVLDNPVLVLATTDPSDLMTLDYIRLLTGMDIRPVLSSKSEISKFIDKYYQLDDILYDLIKNVNTSGNLLLTGKGMIGPGDGESDSPIINLTNFIFMDAVKARASDIHIEPRENMVAVRYRIDGNLKNIVEFPSKIQAYLIAHIKVMAALDITENRKPQDGRSSFFAENRKIDLRISVLPTHFGEKIVIRLLDVNLSKTDLGRIGFSPEELETFRDAITKPQGMVLVTGPTGSGKTSTLY
ncbi:MAG: ATPase, T2SS/T4P/T4SS family, partial [Candidatus Omnitrophica bacterium]|nr:ATPase, T2SS/T4P/T4SS family [Candidatus Omnitrophota bacterium]